MSLQMARFFRTWAAQKHQTAFGAKSGHFAEFRDQRTLQNALQDAPESDTPAFPRKTNIRCLGIFRLNNIVRQSKSTGSPFRL